MSIFKGPLPEYAGGYGCDQNTRVRRLTIWSPDMGNIEIKGPGYETAPKWDSPSYGTNAGTLYYDKSHGATRYSNSKYANGYAAHVVIGREYTIKNLQWKDDIFIEISDPG